MKENKTLLSREQVADMLGISYPTLNAHVNNGLIPAYKLGRRVYFKLDEVLDSLKQVQAK